MTGGHPSATGHSNAGTSAASSVYGSKNTNYDLIEDNCEMHVMRLSRCQEDSSTDWTEVQLGGGGVRKWFPRKKKRKLCRTTRESRLGLEYRDFWGSVLQFSWEIILQ